MSPRDEYEVVPVERVRVGDVIEVWPWCGGPDRGAVERVHGLVARVAGVGQVKLADYVKRYLKET